MSNNDLPNFKFDPNNPVHGPHADGLAGTSFGSHHIRIDGRGSIFNDDLRFSNRFMRDNGMIDPRATAMGGLIHK